MPHSQGNSIPHSLSCCPLLLDLILHSSRVKKIYKLAENVNENTYFFYLCLSVSVVSSSSCIHVALSSFVTRLRACLFLYASHNPLGRFFSLSTCSSFCTFSSPDHHVLCPFLSFKTLCAFLCLFSLFAGTVCWGRAVMSVHPVWLVSGTTLNLMI